MLNIAKKEADLVSVATAILQQAKDKKVLAFYGEMGAGKTTFISYLCRAMGVEDEVSSPTYGYVNEYYSPFYGKIYHFDLYRIDSEMDAYDIGIEEYLYGDDWVLIEWPEKIANLLPQNTVKINITVENENRVIQIIDSND
ncbi:MAG: tRNA (adenosine(37)-N6)-threonylcarbamoyltransferase complex ATPase subunit type 1 TsaE [Crocinitomicaceae bacterium]|nr:tRNA (adenosine(37)-N6)-threonylcarbamoyltransferase complex ATPase subunit type 1 TsaE [Crocinitomicaceae bacterium]